MPKTKEELIEIHKELHTSLDKLLACYITETGHTLSSTNLLQFIEWSHKQTINPSCYKPTESL